MKKLIFLILLVGVCFVWPIANSSVSRAERLAKTIEQFCGTPSTPLPKVAPNMAAGAEDLDEATIRLFFHVMCDTNGYCGLGDAQLDSIFDILSEKFNPHSIYFCTIGTDSILSDFYYYSPDSLGWTDLPERHHDYAIDLFLFDGATTKKGGFAQQIVSTAMMAYGEQRDSLGNVVGTYANSPVTPHEVAHCLGLYHTQETIFGHEHVTRNSADSCYNCETTGDLVCDTEADPYYPSGGPVGLWYFDWDCTFNPDSTLYETCDPSMSYNPDPTNLMAFGDIWCRDSLTQGQGERALSVIGGSSVLMKTGPCCSGIRGDVNGSGGNYPNISDFTYLTNFLFGDPPGPEPPCWYEGNVNGDPDEDINVSDLTYLSDYLFGIPNGPAPPSCDNNCQ